MEHEKPQPPQQPEPAAERDDVRLLANRCPFCHTDVRVDDDEWVSCRSCQARHHGACWSESGSCASCGETRYLAEHGQTAPPADAQGPGITLRMPNLPNLGGPGSDLLRRSTAVGVLGLTAVIALVASLDGADQALGHALAAAAAVSCAATQAKARASFVGATFFSVLGAWFAIAGRSERHIRQNHPEVMWWALLFGVIALACVAIGRVMAKRRPPEPPAEGKTP